MKVLISLACTLAALSGCAKFDPTTVISESDAWDCINSNQYDSIYKEYCNGKSIEITAFVKEQRKGGYTMDKDFAIVSIADRDAYVNGKSSKLDHCEFESESSDYTGWFQSGDKVKMQGYFDDGIVKVHSLNRIEKSNEEIEQFKRWSRNNEIGKLFSAWDGSLPNMVREVKSSLKDPESFEHISTRYLDNGKNIKVFMQYRAINSFGAKVPAVATATVSENGAILELTNAP